MIGHQLHDDPPEHRAARRRARTLTLAHRWHAPEPTGLRAGLLLLGLGGLLTLGYLLEASFGEPGDAALVFLFATMLLISGSVWLLLALGQAIASRLRGAPKRCGSCQFFAVPSSLYVVGRCQANPARQMVTRNDGCSCFCFSERSLARDRLGQHPIVLKQLQITRTDTQNHSRLEHP